MSNKTKQKIGISPYQIICTRKLAEKWGKKSFCRCLQCRELNQNVQDVDAESAEGADV